ncbi:MAG: hypothetical protein MZU97_03485 [Bacillus subtilis]|nr:hypothetical protein [Bacillus subtilis]
MNNSKTGFGSWRTKPSTPIGRPRQNAHDAVHRTVRFDADGFFVDRSQGLVDRIIQAGLVGQRRRRRASIAIISVERRYRFATPRLKLRSRQRLRASNKRLEGQTMKPTPTNSISMQILTDLSIVSFPAATDGRGAIVPIPALEMGGYRLSAICPCR